MISITSFEIRRPHNIKDRTIANKCYSFQFLYYCIYFLSTPRSNFGILKGSSEWSSGYFCRWKKKVFCYWKENPFILFRLHFWRSNFFMFGSLNFESTSRLREYSEVGWCWIVIHWRRVKNIFNIGTLSLLFWTHLDRTI